MQKNFRGLGCERPAFRDDWAHVMSVQQDAHHARRRIIQGKVRAINHVYGDLIKHVAFDNNDAMLTPNTRTEVQRE